MRILFSIEFTYGNRQYCGIVRVVEYTCGIEYHVRVMNARLDKWLYHHHIFRQEPDGRVTFEATDCPQRVQELRATVHKALQERLQKQVIALPTTGRRIIGSGTSYYVHRIGGPDF